MKQNPARHSLALSSDTSYCDGDTGDDWQTKSSSSSLSLQHEEPLPPLEDSAALRRRCAALHTALAAERARRSAQSRAHHARLAELHAVIAELTRERRARGEAVIEEESKASDELESTDQAAPELDVDGDTPKTEQLESSLPQSADTTSSNEAVEDDELSSTSQSVSCDVTHGSESHVTPRHVTRYVCDSAQQLSQQTKMATRVRLKKTSSEQDLDLADESWAVDCANRLSLNEAEVDELRNNILRNCSPMCISAATSRYQSSRLAQLSEDNEVLRKQLARCADTTHRLWTACSSLSAAETALCMSLRCLDHCVEIYDVLLALRESNDQTQRESAELVASQLLSRLENENKEGSDLPAGPWAEHDASSRPVLPWSEECESKLRSLAVRYKTETCSLRLLRPTPQLTRVRDLEDEVNSLPTEKVTMAEMETAIMAQELSTMKCALSRVTMELTRQRARNNALETLLRERTRHEPQRSHTMRERMRPCLPTAETNL